MTDLSRDIGRHDEAIETLKVDVHEIRGDIAEIKQILATSRGGVKVLVGVASVAAGCAAAIAEFIHWLHIK